MDLLGQHHLFFEMSGASYNGAEVSCMGAEGPNSIARS